MRPACIEPFAAILRILRAAQKQRCRNRNCVSQGRWSGPSQGKDALRIAGRPWRHFSRSSQGLRSEKDDAAYAKRPCAGVFSVRRKGWAVCKRSNHSAATGLSRDSIPLAKRVTDCFKSARLRRQYTTLRWVDL